MVRRATSGRGPRPTGRLATTQQDGKLWVRARPRPAGARARWSRSSWSERPARTSSRPPSSAGSLDISNNGNTGYIIDNRRGRSRHAITCAAIPTPDLRSCLGIGQRHPKGTARPAERSTRPLQHHAERRQRARPRRRAWRPRAPAPTSDRGRQGHLLRELPGRPSRRRRLCIEDLDCSYDRQRAIPLRRQPRHGHPRTGGHAVHRRQLDYLRGRLLHRSAFTASPVRRGQLKGCTQISGGDHDRRRGGQHRLLLAGGPPPRVRRRRRSSRSRPTPRPASSRTPGGESSYIALRWSPPRRRTPLIGSFLNVVAWRLPRGESLVHPGSRCPGCGTPVKPYDNMPVLSWLAAARALPRLRRADLRALPARRAGHRRALRGRRRSARDDALDIALGLLLVTALVPIALIDLERRLIPNAITLPAAVAAVAAALALDPDFVPEQLIAGAAAGGFFLLAALLYPRGMGMGDVKLAGRARALPRARRAPGDVHRAHRSASLVGALDHRAQGRGRGPQDRGAVRAVPGPRRDRRPVRRRARSSTPT